jgi:hypothetical protein
VIAESLDKLFWYLVHEGDSEPLAQYIESGGDLSGITAGQRKTLAQIVRGKSVRGRGQKLLKANTVYGAERDGQICLEIACLRAYGLPAYTDSGVVNHKATLSTDACSVVAKRWKKKGYKLEESTVRKLWTKRDKNHSVLRLLEEAYEGQSSEEGFTNYSHEEDFSNCSREELLDWLRNAWKEGD